MRKCFEKLNVCRLPNQEGGEAVGKGPRTTGSEEIVAEVLGSSPTPSSEFHSVRCLTNVPGQRQRPIVVDPLAELSTSKSASLSHFLYNIIGLLIVYDSASIAVLPHSLPTLHVSNMPSATLDYACGTAFGSALYAAGVFAPNVIIEQLQWTNMHMLRTFIVASGASA